MVAFLDSQISLLEAESEPSRAVPGSEHVRLVEDLLVFHLTALERLEGHLGIGGLSERDRPLMPLFQRWLRAAHNVKARAMESGPLANP